MTEHPDLTGRLGGDLASEMSESSRRMEDSAGADDTGPHATDDETVDHEDQVPYSAESAARGELIPRLSAERNEAMLEIGRASCRERV